jgi:cytoplasmic iron level regulating protein YaaA (DUF328/UPF0246 family)
MKLFSSPTKTLKASNKEATPLLFEKETKKILKELKTLDYDALKKFYKASDKIVDHQAKVIKKPVPLGPAGYVYQGESFRNLNIETINVNYLREHLIIGSALYGLSTVDTIIYDHRLDFMKKLNDINLVDYWKPIVQNFLKDELIINVASNEYRQLIEGLNIIDIVFLDNGKVKSTYAKAARGAFIRQCATQNIKDVQALKHLNIFDYTFDKAQSHEQCLYFTR